MAKRTATKAPRTSTQRGQEFRKRMRKHGLELKQYWVHPADAPTLKGLATKLRRARIGTAA